MHTVILFASSDNGLLQIDNNYKVASPGELVQFDVTIANNEVNRETFLIHHVWEASVLWLPMDLVDSQVYDRSPFGNHGAIYGATLADGVIGEALSFDGSDDYVNCSNGASLNLINEKTISFWIKTTQTTQASLMDKVNSAAPYNGYGMVLNRLGAGKIDVYCGESIGWTTLGNSIFLNDGAFHFITITTSAPAGVLYVDGLWVQNFNYSATTDNSALPLYIGAAAGGGYFFNGIIDEVRIFNRVLTNDEVGWLYKQSWSENLSRYNIELGPGEKTQVAFSVKVPENASAGYVQKYLLTAFSLSNPEHVETQTVTVEVLPKYGVEVSLDENEKKGKPGEILNFQAAIRNIGNIEDTYDIQADGGEAWNLSLPVESIAVPAEEVGSFNISVTVPLDALSGDYTSFRIQAASRGNQNLTTNVNGTAIATAIYRFNITADPELRQASPGSEAIFSLEIKNLGTAPDTIGLKAENLIDWGIEVEPSSQSLEIGETGKATVLVRVPEDALIGQANTITIRAVSSGDPTVSANSSISIEVVTPFWDIPDVRFIVGLSIGVLVGATLISTLILRRAQINRKESRRS
jgi:uncharacterized membrane protein